MKQRLSPFAWGAVCVLGLTGHTYAQTLTGTNAPGGSKVFSFTVPAGTTNLSLAVSNSLQAYSYLILKGGTKAWETNYDFISRLDGQTNQINLQLPEFTVTNYSLRVRTPAASATHAFQVTLSTNRSNMRAAGRPVLKPVIFSTTGLLTNRNNGHWHYFQVDVPTNLPGWRLVVSSTNAASPDLYVRRGALPATNSYDKASTGLPIDTVIFTDAEATNFTYFIGVYLPSNAVSQSFYTLTTEIPYLKDLNWDPGLTHEGTVVYTNTSPTGGNYFFRILPQTTSVGAWRTALNVQIGEAHVYLRKAAFSAKPAQYTDARSERVGPDGFVLPASQYVPGETWYLCVYATVGAEWTLVTGKAYVLDLGEVGSYDSASSSTNVAMGAEGMRFFRTTPTVGTLAWRLWLGGATNDIFVRKTSVPHPLNTATYDLRQTRQMLVVPNYLVGGDQYFIGVADAPGTLVRLDSRQQEIRDLPFVGATSLVVTGCGYVTFRIDVPVEQIAWLTAVSPTLGDANLCVRRDSVPNERNNDAYSEAPGQTTDSISLVPPPPASPIGTPGLSDGVFFVTLYGVATYQATLSSGNPVITDVPYVSTTLNDDPVRVGWRYYRVLDITNQLGSLGWDLFLQSQPPGTELALRRNAVPGRWNRRQTNSPATLVEGYVDVSGPQGFLQRPGHQADIWYVGVYNPTNALGNFVLNLRELVGQPLGFDRAVTNITAQPPGTLYYWRVDVPAGVLGWDLRIANVASGDPRLVIRRDTLPSGLFNTPWAAPQLATNWPSGSQWAPLNDWTDLVNGPTGVSEVGRVFGCGVGNPLAPGTYYVGVINSNLNTTPMTYSLISRGIGPGLGIPVTPLAFVNGMAAVNDLPPREAAYFQVTVPPNTESWKLRLTTNSGEALLVLQRSALPGISAALASPELIQGGRMVQKLGNEAYVLFPSNMATYVLPGTYYVAVVSEGQNPNRSLGRIGTNLVSAALTSFGPLVATNLGTLSGPDLTTSGALAAGEIQTYRFSAAPDVQALEVWIDNPTGRPLMSVWLWDLVPEPPDPYGNDGGAISPKSTDRLMTIAEPAYAPAITLAVMAAPLGSTHLDATYSLRVHRLPVTPVDFDGGTLRVETGHQFGTWHFYSITVPPDAVGWDLRLKEIAHGDPRLVVAWESVPIDISTTPWTHPEEYDYWPFGFQWAAGSDWTDVPYDVTGVNRSGTILQMGMGNPLVPGTYYIAVSGASGGVSSNEMRYTLASRGIGEGYSIPVNPLAFAGGVAHVTNLPPREVEYYSVNVPPGAPGWKVKLDADAGESLLVVQKDFLPNVAAGSDESYLLKGGRQLAKAGSEHYLLLPREDASSVDVGTYYLGVVSAGVGPSGLRLGSNTINATLRSFGIPPRTDLGQVSPLADLVLADTLEGGATAIYQFTVPPGTLSLEVRLEDRVGRPRITLFGDARAPKPAGTYGHDGGQKPIGNNDTQIIVANPTNGIYTLAVLADLTGPGSGASGFYSNATYTVRLHTEGAVPIAFDGGAITVNNQEPGSWRYFLITNLPAAALGWDVRLTNVTSGDPRLVIRCNLLPDNLATHAHPTGGWNPATATNWPSGYQWAAGLDWTGYPYDANSTNRLGHILQMGRGNPLTPGNDYYLGVYKGNTAGWGTNAMTYTLTTRGIGPGMSIPVTPLAFAGGSATNAGLLVREAAHYSIDVPSNTPSWKVRMAVGTGETLLMAQKDALPSVLGGTLVATQPGGGYQMQKAGNEHYVLLPAAGQTSLPAGRYYLLAASEGRFPAATNKNNAGTNLSSHLIQSQGPLPVEDLGSIPANGVARAHSLEGGELKAYRFSVTSNLLGVEVRLDNRVGNPCLALRGGTPVPYPSNTLYGVNGGERYSWSHSRLLSVPTPVPTNFTLVVQANSVNVTNYSDADYVLGVGQIPVTDLALDSLVQGCSAGGSPVCTNAVAEAELGENERAYFRFQVPATLPDSTPVIGWQLMASNFFGNASMRVRKDLLPSDTATGQMPFTSNMAVVVPPFLVPGTWYVEVKGNGSTRFRLSSSAVRPYRPAWTMPGPGEPIITPGLTNGPLFADTGIDTNGLPLPNPDGGIDLEQGFLHYYAVTVPPTNGGLFRMALEAVSGNPDLYIRATALPTLTHRDNGTAGTLYDRSLASTNTQYGNWVPADGRYEAGLSNGVWYLGIRAGGNSNCRYRLKLSTGNVTPLALNGSMTNQTLAAGDWRYYRFNLPANAPATWAFAFQQQVGDVIVYVRDRLPPGQYATITDYRHWDTDDKNHATYPTYDLPGTYTNAVPPLRPGQTYFLGLRAVTDATFSLSSATNTAALGNLPSVNFYGGSVTNFMPPGTSARYRIDVPADGTRWISLAIHPGTVRWYLEQGSLPTGTSADHRSSGGGANAGVNQSLLARNGWPWLPAQTYFLLVTNTAASSQPFSWRMDGRNCSNDDGDNDGLLDCWELTYFASTSVSSGSNDPDGDGNNNLTEFQDGTNPQDPGSMLARLTLTTNGPGTVQVAPGPGPYPYGTLLTLSAQPNPGSGLVGWLGGGLAGNAPVVTLSMTTNRSVSAFFGREYGPCGTLVADYQFPGNLGSAAGTPPPLNFLGTGHFYTNQIVDGVRQLTLRFPQGSGLILSNATSVIASNTYTVALLFKFDTTASYRRILDARNGTDPGLYVNDGRMYFNPSTATSTSMVSEAWHQVVLTRDLAGQVGIYCDAGLRLTVNDASVGYGVINSGNTLRFFKDNTALTQESGGSVARIRLFNCVLSAAEVAALDRLPTGTQFVFSGWALDPGRHFYFKISGPPAPLLRVEGTTDLRTWEPASDFQPFAGVIWFTNQAPAQDLRLFRAVVP